MERLYKLLVLLVLMVIFADTKVYTQRVITGMIYDANSLEITVGGIELFVKNDNKYAYVSNFEPSNFKYNLPYGMFRFELPKGVDEVSVSGVGTKKYKFKIQKGFDRYDCWISEKKKENLVVPVKNSYIINSSRVFEADIFSESLAFYKKIIMDSTLQIGDVIMDGNYGSISRINNNSIVFRPRWAHAAINGYSNSFIITEDKEVGYVIITQIEVLSGKYSVNVSSIEYNGPSINDIDDFVKYWLQLNYFSAGELVMSLGDRNEEEILDLRTESAIFSKRVYKEENKSTLEEIFDVSGLGKNDIINNPFTKALLGEAIRSGVHNDEFNWGNVGQAVLEGSFVNFLKSNGYETEADLLDGALMLRDIKDLIRGKEKGKHEKQ